MAILQLIACPRTLSTALMYSFAQRKDTHVIDEPFYANYLLRTGKAHPGREQILNSQNSDLEHQIKIIEEAKYEHTFVKNIAHHLYKVDLDYLSEYKNILYLRHPKRILTSIAKVLDKPTLLDIGIKVLYEVMISLQEKEKPFLVVNSSDLLANPEAILNALCNALDIKFESSMLTWSKGPKPYDGIWANYWYKSLHQTTGFGKENISTDPLPSHLESLCEEATYYYNQIIPHAIKIN